ncbi:MAG: hypothetical protein ACXAC7_11365, partial [Candidatus Hodarchaeales archaeon]
MFNNWALFGSAEHEKPLWIYGELSEEVQNLIIGFLKGLHGIGKELFDKGIASLRISRQHTSSSNISSFWGDELFIINLEGNFFLVIFDPLSTIKMIQNIEIPTEMDYKIRSVLVGQASLTYAALCSSDEDTLFVDSLFQTVLDEVLSPVEQENLNVYVGEGSCSFSGLNSIQCLVFHYLLRLLFADEYRFIGATPWSIVQHNSSLPILLEYNTPKKPHLLSGYLTVLNDFVSTLFNTKLRGLVFGGSSEIASIDLI